MKSERVSWNVTGKIVSVHVVFLANTFSRVAALKCRQRKKQWLNNLQSKVDSYTNENETLHQKVQQMAHEIMQLKTMLFAHKDTPIGIQQGIAQYVVPPLYDDMPPMHQSQNPYGLGTMPPSQNPNM